MSLLQTLHESSKSLYQVLAIHVKVEIPISVLTQVPMKTNDMEQKSIHINGDDQVWNLYDLLLAHVCRCHEMCTWFFIRVLSQA